MSALDQCEPAIVRAFNKAGWTPYLKPHPIRTQHRLLQADFSLKKADDLIIVIEVKCFTNPKEDIPELYTATGQYELYRTALKEYGLTYSLYLAIPEAAYRRLIQDATIRALLKDAKIKLVLVDIVTEVIVEWIE